MRQVKIAIRSLVCLVYLVEPNARDKPEQPTIPRVSRFTFHLSRLTFHVSRFLDRLRPFVIVIGCKAEDFRLTRGDFLVYFVEPAACAAEDLPD